MIASAIPAITGVVGIDWPGNGALGDCCMGSQKFVSPRLRIGQLRAATFRYSGVVPVRSQVLDLAGPGSSGLRFAESSRRLRNNQAVSMVCFLASMSYTVSPSLWSDIAFVAHS